jgi:hypothetical protein
MKVFRNLLTHPTLTPTHHTHTTTTYYFLVFPRLNRMVFLETLVFFHRSHVTLGVAFVDLLVPRQVAGFREGLAARFTDDNRIPSANAVGLPTDVNVSVSN